VAEGFGGISRAAGGAGASGGAERVPKSFLPAVALGYGAVQGAEAIKRVVAGPSAMEEIEQREAGRKQQAQP
jgi:hypothetical protein